MKEYSIKHCTIKQQPYKKTRLTLNSGKRIVGRMTSSDSLIYRIEDCIIQDHYDTPAYKVNSVDIFKDSVKSMEVF